MQRDYSTGKIVILYREKKEHYGEQNLRRNRDDSDIGEVGRIRITNDHAPKRSRNKSSIYTKI